MGLAESIHGFNETRLSKKGQLEESMGNPQFNEALTRAISDLGRASLTGPENPISYYHACTRASALIYFRERAMGLRMKGQMRRSALDAKLLADFMQVPVDLAKGDDTAVDNRTQAFIQDQRGQRRNYAGYNLELVTWILTFCNLITKSKETSNPQDRITRAQDRLLTTQAINAFHQAVIGSNRLGIFNAGKMLEKFVVPNSSIQEKVALEMPPHLINLS